MMKRTMRKRRLRRAFQLLVVRVAPKRAAQRLTVPSMAVCSPARWIHEARQRRLQSLNLSRRAPALRGVPRCASMLPTAATAPSPMSREHP